MVTELELEQNSERGLYLQGREEAAEVLGRYAATVSFVYGRIDFNPYIHSKRSLLFQDRPLLSLQWDDPIDLISFWPDHWGEMGQYETVFTLKDISLGRSDSELCVELSVSVPSTSNMAVFLQYIQMEQKEEGSSIPRAALRCIPERMIGTSEKVRGFNLLRRRPQVEGVYVFEFGGGGNKISGYVFWEDQEEGSDSFDFIIVLPDEDLSCMSDLLLEELYNERRKREAK